MNQPHRIWDMRGSVSCCYRFCSSGVWRPLVRWNYSPSDTASHTRRPQS